MSMTNNAISVQVTIYAKDTGNVLAQSVSIYDGDIGHEVESMFENLAKKAARIVDPTYEY